MPAFREHIAGAAADKLKNSVGSTFWRTTTIVSTRVLAAAYNITQTSTGGDLMIEDIILRTDQTTGLAGATTFKIQSTNAKGTVTVMREDITRLGAGVTRHLSDAKGGASINSNATDLNTPSILEDGKRLQIRGTGSAGTGAGTVDIHIKFRRMADDADVLLA